MKQPALPGPTTSGPTASFGVEIARTDPACDRDPKNCFDIHHSRYSAA